MFAVKNGQFDGIFFDEENANLAVGDYFGAEIKECESAVEAINFLNKIVSKFYAVANGRIKGIFLSWPDCSAQVTKFSCAKFQSFHSIDEAVDFATETVKEVSEPEAEIDISKTCIAYVDGSFNAKNNEYGWGVVMLTNGKEYCVSGSGNDEEDAKLRNVAGEILGAKRAIERAIEMGCPEIHIYYDYYGIEMWATGMWKRKTKQTIAYHSFVTEAKKRINIIFHKVKGHTGVALNDRADELAKDACGIS